MSEMLARLNPKTCRMDIGTGSVGGLTDQDIAAALGLVRNKLGASLLQYLHCPGTMRVLDFEVSVCGLLRAEADRRADEPVNAELAWLIQQVQCNRPLPRPQRTFAAMWPPFDSRHWRTYALVALGVLREIKGGPACRCCNGCGRAVLPTGVVDCPECSGTGKREDSQRVRAARLSVSLSSYQERWEAPYKWLLGELSTAMTEANSQFRAVLGRRPA